MATIADKLEAMAAHHEDLARAIRLTITTMNGAATRHKQERLSTVVRAATKIRAGNKKPSVSGVVLIAEALKAIGGPVSREDLRTMVEKEGGGLQALGAAVRYGYIKSRGKGKAVTYEFVKSPPQAAAQ